MDRRQELLKRLEKAWRAFADSYAGLSDSELLESGVTGSWSVRDIIAHVTVWEEEVLKHLPLIQKGVQPPRYSVDAFNAQATERKRNLALTEVLRQAEDVHDQLIKLIESTPEEQLGSETRFRRRLRADTYSHYPKHAKAIREWRARERTGL